jgi:hypothetical protein
VAACASTAYNLNMVTTLYGPDSYRRLRKLNELVNFFVQKRGVYSHKRIDLKNDEDFVRLRGFINTSSMFGPKKLLILDDPFEYSEAKELKKILRDNTGSNDTNIIINTEKKFSPSFKFLTEPPNIFYEFRKLEDKELDRFIKEEASRLGMALGLFDVVQIKEVLGLDTWRIVTELERLSLASDTSIKDEGAKVDYFSNLNDIKRGTSVGQRLTALEKLTSGARYDAERLFNGLAFRLNSESEAEMYADYNAATRAGRLDYEEVLVAIVLGLKFNPLDW